MQNDTHEPVAALGSGLAAVLAGAWRRIPPPLSLPGSAVERAVIPLAQGGAGGLAWHRLRATGWRPQRATRELQQHYRLQTLAAVQREEAIRALLLRLRAVGVEPILIKGWSSALLYPEPGLRHSSDIDLCVPAEQVPVASAALSNGPLPVAVDLHADVPDLETRSWAEVWAGSRLLPLGDVPVRVLGPEDQLRLLCLHLVRHGLARPLWLCDIAACLESLPADFAWDRCLSGPPHLAQWVRCVAGLACRLLGAESPMARDWAVPAWVERAVLWCWGNGAGRPLGHYLRHPDEALRRLCYHGLSPRHGSRPIQAALQLGLGPCHDLPLVLVQLAAFVRRKTPHVLSRLLQPRPHRTLPFAIHRH